MIKVAKLKYRMGRSVLPVLQCQRVELLGDEFGVQRAGNLQVTSNKQHFQILLVKQNLGRLKRGTKHTFNFSHFLFRFLPRWPTFRLPRLIVLMKVIRLLLNTMDFEFWIKFIFHHTNFSTTFWVIKCLKLGRIIKL